MMRCPGEVQLDHSAIQLVDLGLTRPEQWAACLERGGPPLPADLLALLAHASQCVRCRELLDLFADTEVRHRASLAGPRIVMLRPLRPDRRPSPSGEREAEFQLAAQTPHGSEEGGSIEGTRVLTMASGDHRYIVRIFPNEGGAGATAVLVGSERGLVLRLSGVEYAFDENGMAQLPSFPGSEIELLVR